MAIRAIRESVRSDMGGCNSGREKCWLSLDASARDLLTLRPIRISSKSAKCLLSYDQLVHVYVDVYVYALAHYGSSKHLVSPILYSTSRKWCHHLHSFIVSQTLMPRSTNLSQDDQRRERGRGLRMRLSLLPHATSGIS